MRPYERPFRDHALGLNAKLREDGSCSVAEVVDHSLTPRASAPRMMIDEVLG